MKNVRMGAWIAMIVLLGVLATATFAWFTSNQIVSTSRVEARTDSSDVVLLVSSQGGDSFRGAAETAIVQVNSTDATHLMPVSTADLSTFFYNANTVDNYASSFIRVEDEKYYYHGRLFIKAEAVGQRQDARLALYLDQSASAGGLLAQSPQNSQLLNAARLGLVIGDAQPYIFSLSDAHNDGVDLAGNTKIGGVTLGEGKVLTQQNGAAAAVDDPAIPIGNYSVSMQGGSSFVPQQPLLLMELNKIYQVDVYFYLEGCDPDCVDSISYDESDLHLAFFGVLD